MPTKRKAPPKKSTAKSSSAPTGMSASQKTIYNKLKRKGMSDKQAAAFSKHADKRKQGTTRNRMAANPKSATRKTVSKKKK